MRSSQKHIKNTKDKSNQGMHRARFNALPLPVNPGAAHGAVPGVGFLGGRPSNKKVAANVREATLRSFNGNATKTPSFSAGHREISHRYI